MSTLSLSGLFVNLAACSSFRFSCLSSWTSNIFLLDGRTTQAQSMHSYCTNYLSTLYQKIFNSKELIVLGIWKTISEFSLVFFRIYWCFCTISAWKTIQNTPCLKEKKERSILPITRLAHTCHPGLRILKYIFRSLTLAKCVIPVPYYHDPPGSSVALTWNATWALTHWVTFFISSFFLIFVSHSFLFV